MRYRQTILNHNFVNKKRGENPLRKTVDNDWTCILTIKKKRQKFHRSNNQIPIYIIVPSIKTDHIEFNHFSSSQENNWRYRQRMMKYIYGS